MQALKKRPGPEHWYAAMVKKMLQMATMDNAGGNEA
jgi:hypothetical protein